MASHTASGGRPDFGCQHERPCQIIIVITITIRTTIVTSPTNPLILHCENHPRDADAEVQPPSAQGDEAVEARSLTQFISEALLPCGSVEGNSFWGFTSRGDLLIRILRHLPFRDAEESEHQKCHLTWSWAGTFYWHTAHLEQEPRLCTNASSFRSFKTNLSHPHLCTGSQTMQAGNAPELRH